MFEIRLHPSKIAKMMLLIVGVLSLAHIGQLCVYFWIDDPDVFDFVDLFDFDIEANLPSFYSALSLLYCSVLLLLSAWYHRRAQDPFVSHWYGLSFIFCLLALDEATSLHEALGNFVEEQDWFAAEGLLYFAWVVPYGILLCVFFLAYLRFLIHLPRRYGVMFLVAGAMFVSGALGLEILSASEAEAHGTETIRYSVLYTIEEMLEMGAIVLFAFAMMQYLEERMGDLKIKFG